MDIELLREQRISHLIDEYDVLPQGCYRTERRRFTWCEAGAIFLATFASTLIALGLAPL